MTKNELIQYLQRMADEAGSQKDLASRLGVSAAYLGDVLHGRREPGDKILLALGLERVVTYRERDEVQK